jgi:response regulator RpfG family c-di-GMP phosphodiesterase
MPPITIPRKSENKDMSERSLLLVDDEENILSALTRLLRREGYNIFRANSGASGLDLLQQNDVAVIISDQRMPEMTGVEFLSKVKEIRPDSVRIVLSGYTDLNVVTDAINRGAVYKFFTKPWDDELLRKNVREAFQYYELRVENERLTMELQSANQRLKAINKDLEYQVFEEQGESLRNRQVLETAQEILSRLPFGVVGIDGNGVLVMVNQVAQKLLDVRDPMTIGILAEDVLPSSIVDLSDEAGSNPNDPANVQMNGADMCVWRMQIGKLSEGRGTILVIAPK